MRFVFVVQGRVCVCVCVCVSVCVCGGGWGYLMVAYVVCASGQVHVYGHVCMGLPVKALVTLRSGAGVGRVGPPGGEVIP